MMYVNLVAVNISSKYLNLKYENLKLVLYLTHIANFKCICIRTCIIILSWCLVTLKSIYIGRSFAYCWAVTKN